jgi:hypothetical protein
MKRYTVPVLLITLLFSISCESQPAGQPSTWSKTWPPETKEGEKTAVARDLLAKNYYIILDSSGSMGERECGDGSTKSEVSKKAFAEFLKVVPAKANVGLLIFDKDGVRERAPLGTNNRSEILAQANMALPGNGTPLFDAVAAGLSAMEQQAIVQLGYGEYHLVVVTDGMANPGQEPDSVVNHIISDTPIVLHTIGFCIKENHPLNQPGRTSYRTAKDPQELIKGLKAVVAESEKF